MVEFILRLVWAVGFLTTSIIGGHPPLEWGWRLALGLVSYASVGLVLQKRNMLNSGFAGLFAILDSAVIAVLLGLSGTLELYGFFVLAPCAYAAAKYGANSAAMAPLACSFTLAAANLAPGPVQQTLLLLQALGILSIGLLQNMGRVIVTVEDRVEVPVPVAIRPHQDEVESKHILDLKENYNKVRDLASRLERRGRRDRLVADLFQVIQSPHDRILNKLAAKLKQVAQVEGLVLYTPAQVADSLVARAQSGEVPPSLAERALDTSGVHNDHLLKRRFSNVYRVFQEAEGADAYSAALILRNQGRLVGAVMLLDRNAESLQNAVEVLDEVQAPIVGILRHEQRTTTQERRLTQAELLYAVATVSTGSDTASNLAARVVRELWDSMEVDHLSAVFLDGEEPIVVARQGSSGSIVQEMEFPQGRGLGGWVRSGAPEVFVFDATEDSRVDRTTALKQRMGSFVMLPILLGDQPYGALLAATHQSGGLDSADLEHLRTISSEITQAVARLEEPQRAALGIMTPAEFARSVDQEHGTYILIEPLRRTELEAEFGRPAIDMMMRTLTRRIRQRLPAQGRICRRAEGDFIVFVPQVSEEFGRTWANDAIAHACMVGLTTPDGRQKIPMALRAKVSSSMRFSESGLAA